MFRVFYYFFKKRTIKPLRSSRYKLIIIFIGLIWYSSSGFLYFEIAKKPDLGWSDALWWTFVTMSTVGYGDYFPVTNAARFLIGVPTMIFGIGFLGFIISETATKLIESRSRRLQGLGEVSMQGHILIINFTLVEELIYLIEELRADSKTQKKDICLIDETLEEIHPRLLDYGVEYIKGNPADESTLERANIAHADYAIILSKDRSDPHSDDQNLATTLIIEKINPKIFSVVEVYDQKKVHQIEVAGADSAVCMAEFRSNLIIQEIQDPGIKRILHNLTSNSKGEQIYFITIKSMQEWKYKELVLWGLDKGYSIIGILRDTESLLNCKPDFTLCDGDKAIVIGTQRVDYIII